MNDEWWRQAVVYQIYPRSFADSDGDGIGDLPGLTSRLDQLQWLGVDAVWVSPIFASPMADFGYDISDHCAIDPLFGTDEDAETLITQAHERGIKVLFDIVLGHTSDQHEWFRRSRSSRTDPLRDFYVWRDGPVPGSADGGRPNNWVAGFPPGAPAWTFDETTAQWYLHSHLPEQPDLNWENPAVVAAQERVLRHWLDRGIDGVRLDSINRLGKDPQLRDNVDGLPLRQQDWPSIHPRLAGVRRILADYPGTVAVGETWLFDQAQLVPYLVDDELHLAHNFVFARARADARLLASVIEEYAGLVPHPERAAWFFSNHDEPRLVSRFNDDGFGLARAELLAMLLLSLRGTTFLYQGEELGLADACVPADRVVDRNGRDPQRAPIPWLPPAESGPGAGFTTGEPWLPMPPEADTRNVATQRSDPASTLHLYRDLIAFRREHLHTPTAPHRVAYLPPGALQVTNTTATGRYQTILNLGAEPVCCPGGELLLGTDRLRPHGRIERLDLQPLEGVVLRAD
ncbi:alpha-amylase family glycosyl hydrolase [Enemella evansiae]|uniref:alpha-amylase family glycosyl hydrolase n=1 Tax=Enemella evansiae TaxID=2016499 RepID=UPI00105C30B2|nr:alpha-amylase family glycosyl hydrolase [Enemella evansiae]TDO87716.1 alpha-glucosidase [Enemella evansiae]